MKDMRDFINEGEKVGLVKRITAEVDPYLELSHIAIKEEKREIPEKDDEVKEQESEALVS